MQNSTYASIRLFIRRYRHEIALAFIALSVRCLFLLLQSHADPLFFAWSVDEETYLTDAQRWVDAGFATAGLKLPFWQPPGYMMLLAAWLGVGTSPESFVFLQLLIGVASTLLLYRIIIHVFGEEARRHGLLAAGLFAIVPAILYYETKLLKPAWVIFLMLWILYLSLPRTRMTWWPLRGLLAGVLVIFDVYFIIIPFALLFATQMKRGPLFSLACGLLVTVGPIAALNASAKAGFVLVSYNGPINLYVGNNADWTRTYNTLPGWTWYKITLMHEGGAGANAGNVAATGELFVEDVVRFAREEPVKFAKGLATKALLFFSLRELPRNGSIFMHPAVLFLSSVINAAVMLIAFVCLPRLKREPLIMLLLLMIFAVNVVFFPTTRYRLPAIPLALIAIGALAGRPAIWVKRTSTFVVLLALGATILAGRIVQYDAWLSFSLNEAAWNEIDRNDPAHAEQLVHEALQAKRLSRTLDTAGQLATSYRRDTGQAMSLFDEAIRVAPDYPEPHFNRARMAMASGQPDEAYRLYDDYLDLIRPELADFNEDDTRAALQALEFNARMDFERGRLPLAVERLERLKKIQQQHPVKEITISGLDFQIEMIQRRIREEGHL